MQVGIIGAMAPEVAILRDRIDNPRNHQVAGFEFISGQLEGRDVVLVQSGIGKVAAAVATTLMIARFNPDAVINTGSAGGLDAGLAVGDIVISSELRHHDVDVTAFGYEYGQVPNMPPAFKADPVLLEKAVAAANEVGGARVVTGLITTGDSFMCDPERIAAMQERFPGVKACEMEGAAIAQCCYQLNVPMVVIRSLSDIAGKASPMSFEAYLEKASRHSSAMVMALLKRL